MATPTSDERHAYFPALDGLRAIAVLLVMSEHLRAFAFPQSRVLPPGGYIGVDIFFVLSGFLITSLLLDERAKTGRISFRGFYRRRIFRLFPALAAFLLVQLAAAAAAGQSFTDELHFVLGAFTYTSNWVISLGWSVPANTGHLWSLAVEEQFYLLWPITLALVARRWGGRAIAIAASSGIVIALVSRAYLAHRWGTGYPIVYAHTETRLDGLLLGALLAWARQSGWRPSRALTHVAGSIGLVVLAWYVVETNPAQSFLYTRGGYTLLVLAACAVTMAALDATWAPSRLLALRIPVFIGRLSYSLYLWHMLMLFLLLSFLEQRGALVAAAIFAVASFVPSYVSYVFVEAPLRRYGHRTPRERAPARVHERRPATVRHPRPAWALAGGGAAVLLVVGVVPAYAARDDIVARDRAAAAAAAVAGTGNAVDGAPAAVATAPDETATTIASALPAAPSGPGPAGSSTTASSPPGPTIAPGAPKIATTLVVEPPASTTSSVLAGTVAATVAARLVDATGAALPGRTIHFDTDVGTCDAVTDANGRAACAVAVPTGVVPATAISVVRASFAGDTAALPAEGSWP